MANCPSGFFMLKIVVTMNIKKILRNLNERPIAFYPAYVKITNDLHAGLLLSQLMYWNSVSKGEEFYKTNAEIMDETALTEHTLKKAKSILKKLKIVSVSRKGIPAKTYYKVNEDLILVKLSDYDGGVRNPIPFDKSGVIHQSKQVKCTELNGGDPLDKLGEFHPTGWEDISQLDSGNSPVLYTENTTENTTENKPPNPLKGGTSFSSDCKIKKHQSTKIEGQKKSNSAIGVSEVSEKIESLFKEEVKNRLDEFHSIYPGRKMSKNKLLTWALAKKRKKELPEILEKLVPAIESQKRFNENKSRAGEFVPGWRNMSTWLNDGAWEWELEIGEADKKYILDSELVEAIPDGMSEDELSRYNTWKARFIIAFPMTERDVGFFTMQQWQDWWSWKWFPIIREKMSEGNIKRNMTAAFSELESNKWKRADCGNIYEFTNNFIRKYLKEIGRL